MKHPMKNLPAVGFALLIAIAAACQDRSPRLVLPTGPSLANQVRLEIRGRLTLDRPGDTAQLTAVMVAPDGQTTDVTAAAQWRSLTPIVTVSPAGLITAVEYGDATISVTHQHLAAHARVQVMPEGTYILRGYVLEPGNLPLANAKVEVITGPTAGRFVITGSGGLYTLYGISEAELRVSKEGYGTVTRSVRLTGHATESFELQPLVPPANVAGTYSMTLSAAGTCDLPADLRQSTYEAVVEQRFSVVKVTLKGATFLGDLKHLDGRVSGNVVELSFGYDDFYYGRIDGIVEQMGTTYLARDGSATVSVGGTGLSGRHAGTIAVWEGAYNRGTPKFKCTATDHRLVMQR